jgi:YD repeat-containing protein
MGWFLSLGGRMLGDYAGDPQFNAYQSADGALHSFWNSLRHFYDTPHSYAGETATPGVYYTRDGSYLKFDSTTRVLESPDGLIREFDTAGRLTKMRDRAATPNYVTIAYNEVANPIAPGSTTWHIHDSQGRDHYVYFKPTAEFVEDSGLPHESVAAIDVAAFGGRLERYTFVYDQEGTIGSPGPWTTLPRPPCCIPSPSETVDVDPLPATTMATLLLKIQSTTTDGSATPWRYGFSYKMTGDDYDAPEAGILASMTLPTGGEIDYEYTNFTVPPVPCDPISKCTPGSDLPVSVSRRTVKTASGAELGHRTYSDDQISFLDGSAARVVTEYDASGAILRKSRHYFSICTQTNLPCASKAPPGEYGLPLSHVTESDGLALSVQQFGVTHRDLLGNASIDWSQVARSTYLKYEADFPLSDVNANRTDWNRRLVAEKTVFEDGHWAKTVYSDFDGFGHYRRTDTDGDFDGTNARTSVTKYNPATGTFLPAVKISAGPPPVYQVPAGFNPWPSASPWILDTFTYQTTSAAEAPPGQTGTSKTAMSIACFDANGFLARRRQLAADVADVSNPPLAATDLFTAFTLDSGGNVVKEQHLGGDNGAAPTSDTCNASVGSEAYRVNHTWRHGSLATSQYVDASGTAMTFRSVDHGTSASDDGIDPGTGLPSWSRARAVGTAGMKTTYGYDFLGRPTEIRSDSTLGALAEGGTVYNYTFWPPAVDVYRETAGSSPSRTATQPDGSTTSLPHLRYDFDVLGRVTKESKDMPDGTILARVTEYNALGWKKRISEWETGTPSHFTEFIYDAFGRPLTVKAPDGSVVQQSYQGISSMTRTVQVRTGTSSTNLATSDATMTETYDRHNRLLTVVEPSTGTGTTTTRYTYDVGGRLASVCSDYSSSASTCGQTRAFTYDNRGFLTGETHPEKGTSGNGSTYYAYDARGHVTRRYEGAAGGAFDLTYSYDRAERLKTIAETNVRSGASFKRTLKAFDYGTDNVTGDYRNGQLTRASRFNWFDSRDTNVQIVEQYVYGGAGGRPSSRTTNEYECAISAGASCNAVAPNAVNHVFTQTFNYDDQGSLSQLGYPCRDCGASPTYPMTASSSYSRGMLSDVQFPYNNITQTNSLSYSRNGMLYQVQHANGVTDTQQPDPDMMQRPLSFETNGASEGSACTAPTITANPVSRSATSGSLVTLTAGASGDSSASHPLHYQWYKGDPQDTSTPVGTDSPQYQFTASATTAGAYWMRATNDCSASSHADTAAATVNVCSAPSITAQPASTSTTKGISKTLSVTATGQNLTYQWYAGSTPIAGEVSSSVTVSPTSTTTYYVAVGSDCGTTSSQHVTITVYNPPTPPTTFSASGSNVPGSVGVPVHLQWSGATFPAGFGKYQIQRTEPGVLGYVDYVTVTGQSNDDSAVNRDPNGILYYAYAYRVIAIDANGARSAPSAADVALVAILADDPLPVNAAIRGQHFSQLRRAIDAVRAAAGLNPMWTNYDPLTGGIMAADVANMRLALDEARVGLKLKPVTYTVPSPVFKQPIVRDDIEQIRQGVK